MMIDAKLVGELRRISGAGMMDCKKALEATNADIDAAINYLREKGITNATKKAERIAAEGLANIFINDNKAIILEINSETDFVSKNEEFINMFEKIGTAILNSNVKTIEEALNIDCGDGTINEYIIAKTAKIGEKLSLRRFEIVEKSNPDVFGAYLHMGGKIAVLTMVENTNEEIAKDVAMQAAAMRPQYLSKEDVPTEVVEAEKKFLTEEAIKEGKPAEIAEKMVIGRINKFFKEICLVSQPFIKENDIDVETYVKNNGGRVKKMIRYEVGEGIEKRNDNFAEEVMNQISK
ncbi:MAG: translation elongation factor Ts [Bacilli bacterium]|nr:translation elongation factor Ts [Bacilli bacterium]MDD4407078.1 translation elongation factor Ts [Bacilli bacterium]